MRERFFLFSAAFLFALASASADEIHTKEGTVITGKIIKEDDDIYMIRLGANMNLSVDKNKVDHVVRDAPPPPKHPPRPAPPAAVASSTPSVSVAAVSSAAVSATAPVPSSPPVKPVVPAPVTPAAPSPSPVRPAPAGSIVTTSGQPPVTFTETRVTRTYDVRGVTADQIEAGIFDEQRGKGRLEGRRRIASWTTASFDWAGQSSVAGGKTKWSALVVTSTLSVTVPRWVAPPKPDPAVTGVWNDFLKQIDAYEGGHWDVIRRNLAGIADSLAMLRADNDAALRHETQAVMAAAIDKINKQRQGYDRRGAAHRPKVKKS